MSFRLFLITVLVVIAVINIAVNYQTVEYLFLWNKGTLPLSVISLFSMAYGALLGILYLSYIRSNKKTRKENSAPVDKSS